MNYNIVTYLIYLSLTAFITIYVGYRCYQLGRPFLTEHVKHVDSINKLLLLGYYLLNIGYAFIALLNWTELTSVSELIQSLAAHIGHITLVLGGIHCLNLLSVIILGNKKHNITNPNACIVKQA